tara:strand:+ start:98 stop:1636 length:1539 start_codon:yes stop_codon:yes gene_type:complete
MSEIPLYKDEKYVELLGETLRKLKEGFESNAIYRRLSESRPNEWVEEALSPERYNRAVNALLSQPNRAFLEVMEKGQALGKELNIAKFALEIKAVEDNLLRNFQLLKGMEAHHILPQNVMTWLSELSPKKALHALHLYRKGGGTTGVVPENIKLSSQLAHRASKKVRLLADAANDKIKGVKNFISAHVDPVSDTLADNTKFFMEGFDRNVKGIFKQAQRFTEKDSLKFIVQTIKDQAGDPSKLFAEVALNQDVERKAREWIGYLTGRDDLFELAESGTNSTLIKKYNKAISSLNINFNDIVKGIAEGNPLPEVSEDIRNVFKTFGESAASKVDKTWAESKLLRKLKPYTPDTLLNNPFVGKTLRGKGTRTALGVVPFIGLPVDAAHAYGSTRLAFREPSIDNTLRAGSSWVNFIDQTGLFDAYVHLMTDPNFDPNKGPAGLLQDAIKGSISTSIPSDNNLGAHLAERERNKLGPGGVVKYKKIKKDENDEDEYGYASRIRLQGVGTGTGVKW